MYITLQVACETLNRPDVVDKVKNRGRFGGKPPAGAVGKPAAGNTNGNGANNANPNSNAGGNGNNGQGRHLMAGFSGAYETIAAKNNLYRPKLGEYTNDVTGYYRRLADYAEFFSSTPGGLADLKTRTTGSIQAETVNTIIVLNTVAFVLDSVCGFLGAGGAVIAPLGAGAWTSPPSYFW